MSETIKKMHEEVQDLLEQIADYDQMILHNVDNKFMQDEFSNRRSGLVVELGKVLEKLGVNYTEF